MKESDFEEILKVFACSFFNLPRLARGSNLAA